MKSNKYEDARLEKKEDSIDAAMRILHQYFGYEKSKLLEDFGSYEENLKCLQDVTDRLLDCMKGYGVSFKPEITDTKGRCSEEKLSAFVEKLLTIWADKCREETYSPEGENLAELFIRKRQELYSCCLYILMRCCLEKGAYTLVTGSKLEERADFAFLLEEARIMMRTWCVMAYPELEGKKINELLYGYDDVFGLHIYLLLLSYKSGDVYPVRFTNNPPKDRLKYLTDEGNVKQSQLKKFFGGQMPDSLTKETVEAAKADEADISDEEMEDEDGYEDADGEDGSGYEDDYASEDIEMDDYFEYDEDLADYYALDYDPDYLAEKDEQEQAREILVDYFAYPNEYIAKCRRFVELFRQAETEVLRDFCKDIEEIVTLYLIGEGIPPLLDTDKTLNVYGSIYDQALQQAKRYERGNKWKKMR